ncbi:MAG: penicillin-binding protein [Granulicatella sp.]|jgi:penicillin-binding protein 1B|uniref:transglycosylase domain-containing protein n=1 Tax=unclassified Granulicatella TaxID=2630493 RepID=UPI00066BA331|nr:MULTISPECIES: transglycosylase domain-containing protein [unclassified Granulicatella]MBF1210794.1 penicillin-binding protein [Granulicatella sp.]
MSVQNQTPDWREALLTFWNKPILKNIRFIFNIAYSVLKNIFVIAILFLMLLGIFGGGIGLGYFASLTSNEEPLTQEQMSDAIGNLNLISSFHYSDGTKISDVNSDELRIVKPLSEISQYVIDGIISTEDSSFYEHNGIVPKALLRAILQEAVSSGSGATGGSTLTQQLIKQQILTSEVTFKRKANEILYALRLEKHFTKDQILEAYLNVSSFGRNHNGLNIAGIEEAAQGVFGVAAKDLTLPQAAYLVGMPQNPIVYTPYTNQATLKEDTSAGIERMKFVLFSMYRENKITKEQYEEALAYDITKDFLPPKEISSDRQSYLYQAVNREAIKVLITKAAQKNKLTYDEVRNDSELYSKYYDEASRELSSSGYKITSTIDQKVYDAMQKAIASYGNQIGPTYNTQYVDQNTGETKTQTEPAQNGAVMIENKTGRILGFVAGRDFESNQVDHAFTTHRSPGSTIKPILVYAPAIENNLIYPASIVPDTKVSIPQGNGTYWQPTNYGNTITNQFLTVRYALFRSFNNPVIKIYQTMLQKGINAGEYLKKMGIKGITEDEYQNIALSIGGTRTGPTVLEQTSAFSTLANGGEHHDAYLIEKIEDSRGNVVYQHEDKKERVFSDATAYLTTNMLQDIANSTQFYNMKGNMGFSSDLAGKTGTSENEIDNWFVAYTPTVTLGSWIGYDNFYNARYAITAGDGYGEPTTRSQRQWTYLMKAAYEANPELIGKETTFKQPDSVYRDSVVSTTGTKAGTFKAENGGTYSISGGMTTDWFKKDFPPMNPFYNFAIGATPEEMNNFWNKATPKKEEKKDTKKDEKKNEKKDEKKDEKKNEKKEETTQSPSTQSQTTRSN